ncbi:MAG: hypothetical protein JWQ35_1076 [Bacteriovoracaceae bacterium]|nr:hypothetical protein [Bacteriovoracaceae bacterium]
MNFRSAVSAVNKAGSLLVFPIKNQREPASLWSEFFPKSVMRWEWDQDGDSRVADLWHFREKLSSSGKVVYSKWFRGRATLFSRELLPSFLQILNPEIEGQRFTSFERGSRDFANFTRQLTSFDQAA